MGLESAADACLVQHQYEEALAGYYQLDALIPRLVTKIAFCEWLVGRYDDARKRLFGLEDELEADGVGLLCDLIRCDANYKRREAEMDMIWPRLQAVTSSEFVPLLAALARSQAWWPGDHEDREQRHRDIEHLLSLHPGSQKIRLAVLAGMQSAETTVAEQYALLRAWQYPSPIPRYLWEAAKVAADMGKLDKALEYLDQLEAFERRSEHPSHQLRLEINLARCDIAAKREVPDSFSGFDRLLGDASLNSDDKTRVIRAALAVACNVASDRVPELADDFLGALESSDYGLIISPSELLSEAYPINGDGWDTYGDTWSYSDLTSCRDILVSASQGRASLFFRAVFAVAEIDEKYDDVDGTPDLPTGFWDDVADLLGDIADHDGEFGGRLLSLHTAIHAHRHRPNWAIIGQDWIASEWVANQNGHDDTHGRLTLEAAGQNADSTRIFATRVIKRLRNYPVPAPLAVQPGQETRQNSRGTQAEPRVLSTDGNRLG